jgi:hypothetical protein
MDIINILKNKFVLSFIISLILLGCLFQFNKYNEMNKEVGEKKEDINMNENLLYYAKFLVLFYIISFVLVLAVSKGNEYYKNNKNTNFLKSLNIFNKKKKVEEQKELEEINTKMEIIDLTTQKETFSKINKGNQLKDITQTPTNILPVNIKSVKKNEININKEENHNVSKEDFKTLEKIKLLQEKKKQLLLKNKEESITKNKNKEENVKVIKKEDKSKKTQTSKENKFNIGMPDF